MKYLNWSVRCLIFQFYRQDIHYTGPFDQTDLLRRVNWPHRACETWTSAGGVEMFASRSPATPEQEETLQDLLNALTKPPKWMVGTATVTGVASVNESSSPNENATWMAGGMRNHENHNANTTIADTWPLTVKDVVTISSVSPEEEVIGIETNFWYKYGISITIAVLVLVVALVLIIQCRMVYLKTVRRRRLVDFVNGGNVNRSNKARDEIFESFHRQATASLSASRLQPAPAHEEIPMRHLRETRSANRWSTSMRGSGPEPLARVYPLRFDPVWDKNGNITDPYPCNNRRLWNTTAGLYPIRVHRSVLSEPAIARPTSRRYSSRNRIRKIPVMRGDTRLPKYNLSGKRIVTSPETNAFLRMRNSEIRRHTVAYGEPNVGTLLMEVCLNLFKIIQMLHL